MMDPEYETPSTQSLEGVALAPEVPSLAESLTTGRDRVRSKGEAEDVGGVVGERAIRDPVVPIGDLPHH